MTDFNSLNFPSFPVALDFWYSGTARKLKLEDDWGWWFACIITDDLRLIRIEWDEKYFDDFPLRAFAIPAPSLGEMLDVLKDKGYWLSYWPAHKKWRVVRDDYYLCAYEDTAPDACAKGLMEVYK